MQTLRGKILRRYSLAIVGVVAGVLLLSSSLNTYFSYSRIRTSLSILQQEKARNSAEQVENFIRVVHVGLTATAKELLIDTTAEQRLVTMRRLLRLAPEVTELSLVDLKGTETVVASRLETDRLDSGRDRSSDEGFKEAADAPWFSPIYFISDSEPHMSISVPLSSAGGVLIADVNLTFVQEVVVALNLDRGGYAFVVDSKGLLVAHPDLSLVLRKTNVRTLPHVESALDRGISRSSASTVERSFDGTSVFSAHESATPPGWLVFVEQPVTQAFLPLREHLIRTAAVFVLGLLLAVFTSVFMARRLTEPVGDLHRAASAIGAGDLEHEVRLSTGDELEDLGREFDRMRIQLRARLEELRASRRRLVSAQDEERRKMERDIHDGAQQQLVSLSVKLGIVKTLLNRDIEKAAALLDVAVEENSEALTTLRDLARGLYPPSLRDDGLVAAVASHIDRLPMDVTLDDGGLRGVRFPQEIEGQVYFCIREALQNVSKYADGASVQVSLSSSEGSLEFAVTDRGPGFDVEKVKRGAGLQNMEDRLQALGGELVISSSVGSGSSIAGRVELPS